MSVVAFDFNAWVARYPELSPPVEEPAALLYFAEAQLYLNNTPTAIVEDVATRAVLLNMLVAHIAAIAIARAPGGGGIVGRVASASEGSVSVSADMQLPGSAAWFAQTAYGAAYWQATAQYRTMRYRPGPRPFLGVPRSSWLR